MMQTHSWEVYALFLVGLANPHRTFFYPANIRVGNAKAWHLELRPAVAAAPARFVRRYGQLQ